MHIVLRIIIYIHHKYFKRLTGCGFILSIADVKEMLEQNSFHLNSDFYFAVFLFYSSILSWSEMLTWFTTALKINLKEKITCASYLWGHTVISEHGFCKIQKELTYVHFCEGDYHIVCYKQLQINITAYSLSYNLWYLLQIVLFLEYKGGAASQGKISCTVPKF